MVNRAGQSEYRTYKAGGLRPSLTTEPAVTGLNRRKLDRRGKSRIMAEFRHNGIALDKLAHYADQVSMLCIGAACAQFLVTHGIANFPANQQAGLRLGGHRTVITLAIPPVARTVRRMISGPPLCDQCWLCPP